MMDHPNIARVFDGGATDGGRPYFVMELVKGVPITEYCDKNELSTEQRLKLFTTVCQAVQHAHQKGIIHRDLKPSNVLVTLADGEPVVKVIDFGVAKATNQQLTEKTLFTAFGQMVGTPQYMSPEQAEMSCLDVDTRSDVYSLGVLLYELLTGTTPLEAERLRTAGYAEMQRLIRDEEPPKPSTRLSTSGDKLTIIAKHRKVTPEKLKSQVKGDLDWIVMKALEKDRNRRYETAAGLAKDVGRYLNDEPLSARPPSTIYRLKKYARRNKGLVASLALVLGGIFFALSALGYHLATLQQLLNENQQLLTEVKEERDRANYARDEAERYLASLAEELADRAVDAAFSNRQMEFQEAIEKAELARVPADVVEAIKGLHAFVDGDNEKALSILLRSSEEHPASIATLSALGWVYHHLNYQSEREEVTQRCRSLTAASTPKPYERFFLALMSFVGGSRDQLRETRSLLDDLLARRSRWGAAYALRANVQMELAMETQQFEDFEMAVSNYKSAMAILPDSVFVKSVGLYAITTAIEFAEANEHPTEDWVRLATEIAEEFSHLSDGSLAHARASVFFYRMGDEQRGMQIETEFGTKVPSASERTAIRIENGEPFEDIAHNLSRREEDPEAQLTLAITTALNPGMDQQAAQKVLDDFLSRDDVPNVLYVLALDCAYLLQRPDLVQDIIRNRKLHTTLQSEWRWWGYVIDYHTDDMTEPELLEKAGPFSNSGAMANYAIAVKAMGNGHISEAKEYFRRTVATRRVGWWNYHWAKVYLKHLEQVEDR